MIHSTFSARGTYHWTYVLPAEVLTNKSLKSNGEEDAFTLRKAASSDGLCFASVLRPCGDGLYWALVASNPDQLTEAHSYRVLLTEEHLATALPWDARLYAQSPQCIRRLLRAHANAVQPACRHVPTSETLTKETCTPTPQVLLSPLPTVLTVTTAELETAAESTSRPGTTRSRRKLQPMLLGVVAAALASRLQQTRTEARRVVLQGMQAVVEQVWRWQRRTHQRVVHLSRGWSDASQQVCWHLTVGVPDGIVALFPALFPAKEALSGSVA